MQVFKVSDRRVLVRLGLGEELMASLRRFMADHEVGAGVVRGLGASRQATVAFYLMDEKRYDPIPVAGFHEVVSLMGNLSWKDDGDPVVHVHAALGRRDGTLVGGHVLEMETGATMELDVELLPGRLTRSLDEDIGLPLLSLYHCGGPET